jgi:hypothetical protein
MADNGVQMPGPISGSYESGFNPVGEDLRDMAPHGANPVGVHMPHGSAEAEAGWKDGSDMSNLASQDPIPVANNFGVLSDSGSVTDSDEASSAGYHFIRSFSDMFGSSSVSIPGIPDADTAHMSGYEG